MTGALPHSELDHIVVAAATLGSGIEFIERQLGVRVPMGGKHPVMNTHNAVMRLGLSVYFEIIATDPEAGPAGRPRWFDLDHQEVQARLASDGPFLMTWVARTRGIAAVAAASRVSIGAITPMSRGSLAWQAAIRADGSLHCGGLFPGLVIEWPPGPHPLENMADLGVVLERLVLRPGNPSRLRADLDSIGLSTGVEIAGAKRGAAPLEAVLRLADGSLRTLRGGGTPLPSDAVCA